MKTLVLNRNLIILIVMLLLYGIHGISYGQGKAPTVTPGENNTSLIVDFPGVCDKDKNAYQVQLRRKSPQGEWITECVIVFVSRVGGGSFFGLLHFAGSSDCVGNRAIFGALEPGVTYEVRYRDTNLSECVENPPNPGPWSAIGEGATHLVPPPRAEFVDTLLASAVRLALHLDLEGVHIDFLKIPKAELAQLTHFGADSIEIAGFREVGMTIPNNVSGANGFETRPGVRDLTGLEHATQLTTLDLSSNQISDLTPLGSLTRLTELDLSSNQISDLTPLGSLTRLTELDLSSNQISDIAPFARLTQLTELDLNDNQIRDVSALARLTQLTELDLRENQIRDTSPLTQLTQLTWLWLWNNQISDISPLAELPSLKYLSLPSNQISDVTLLTTFASLGNLLHISLNGNPITDVSPVRRLQRENPNLRISIDIPVILTDPGDEPDLYVIADGAIFQLNLNEINAQKISSQPLRIYDIAIDAISDKIYWATRDDIRRANLDGTHVQEVVTELDEPEDIALDVSGGKIYWTIENGNRIQRANLDGSDLQEVVTGLYRPYGIALDVAGGKIYWMEEGDHRIRRANLDGTNIQEVVTGVDEPEDIAIDVWNGKIYWTEGSDDRIQRANLDGSDLHVIVPDLEGPRGITLDVPGGKIYWTDYSENMIYRANLDGSNVQVVAIGMPNPTVIGVHDGTVNIQATPKTTITDAAVSISPAAVASPAVGQQLKFNLNITGGKAVAGYQATLQFDRTILRYVSSANGDYLPAGAFFVEPTVERNLVKLNAASLAGESNGDGTLATITFEVIAVKGSTLTLSDVLLTNSAGEAFVPRVENAEITESIQSKGDINRDGMVNIQDLVLVASNLGKTGQNAADVNGDRIVNIQDLVLVAGALGASTAAPSLLHPQSLEVLAAADVKQWLFETQQFHLTDATSQRGIQFLEQLLMMLTPKEMALLPNFPNPFNPETWIPYHLSKGAEVTLHIYAVNGTLVRTLTLGHQPAGLYQSRSRAAYWDGRNAFGEKIASGVYFYTVTAGDFTATRKMLIRK